MSGKFVRTVALGALFTGLMAAPLLAAPADVVKSRIASFRDLGAAFKNVNDELKSDSPTTVTLQISAREINNLAKQQYGWFPAGSGPESGAKTRAKPEIWTQAKQFKAAQDALATQAKALADAVAGGDVGKMQAQTKALSQSCTACHNTFRAK